MRTTTKPLHPNQTPSPYPTLLHKTPIQTKALCKLQHDEQVTDQHLFVTNAGQRKKQRKQLKVVCLYDADLVGDVQGVVVGRQLDVSLLLTVGPEERKCKGIKIRFSLKTRTWS